MSASDRRAMLGRADKTLSLRRQCALVGVARSGVYPALACPFLRRPRYDRALRHSAAIHNLSLRFV
jgi:hypothetical protein